MRLWTLEPRDPLVVRDGRPNRGRSESATLGFPYPSTLAGLVRTRLGSDADGRFTAHRELDALRGVEIVGPLLVCLDSGPLFAPAPRDCRLVAASEGPRAAPLRPMRTPDGAATDDLAVASLVGLAPGALPAGKPPRRAPRFWAWPDLERWLVASAALDPAGLMQRGLEALPVESRVHVAIGESETAEEGMLFGTDGLRFVAPGANPLDGAPLALLVGVGGCRLRGAQTEIRPGVVPAGGERRLCRWAPAAAGLTLPGVPRAVLDSVSGPGEAALVRVVLLTPAIFEAGWRPGEGGGCLLGRRGEVEASLVAACLPRPDTISGWDFERRGPKATRRLVAAGSVFWIELRGAPEARAAWVQEVWMSNVSDAAQDRRDGFGLAVVGVAS